jgi:hypothetical protein
MHYSLMEEMSLPFIDSVLVHLYIEVPFKAGLTVCCAYCPYKLYALYPQEQSRCMALGTKQHKFYKHIVII